MENYLKQALKEVGLDKLPERSTKVFEGLAVAKIKRVSGQENYVVVHFDESVKKTLVAIDFGRGMIDSKEGMEVYPDPKRIPLSDKDVIENLREALVKEGYAIEEVKTWNKPKLTKEVKEILSVKQKLEQLGVKEPIGTLSELKKKRSNLDVKTPPSEKVTEKDEE